MRGLEGLVREFQSSKGTSKEDICRTIAADVLIDDDLRHLRDVRLPGLKRILLQHGRAGTTGDCGGHGLSILVRGAGLFERVLVELPYSSGRDSLGEMNPNSRIPGLVGCDRRRIGSCRDCIAFKHSGFAHRRVLFVVHTSRNRDSRHSRLIP